MKKKSTLYITQAAVIAALYVALTYVSNSLGLAYNAVQFRLSEILSVLPVFTPAAIPGLVIGCVIANISSPFGIADIICGSVATLLAALCSYALKNVKFRGVPVLATLPPVLFNGLIIGLEIWYFGGQTPQLFFVSALEVMAGQVVMCMLIGIPFISVIKKTRIFENISKHL